MSDEPNGPMDPVWIAQIRKGLETDESACPVHRRSRQLWGKAIATAIQFGTQKTVAMFNGEQWCINGHIGWRSDVHPGWGWTRVNDPEDNQAAIGLEIRRGRVEIDIDAPVCRGIQPDSMAPASEFCAGVDVVRYSDAYIDALRSVGDSFGVSPRMHLLVACKDGRPVAIALPIARQCALTEARP